MLFKIKRLSIQTEVSLAIRSALSHSLALTCASVLYLQFIEGAEKFDVWRSLFYSPGTNACLEGLLS